MTVQQSPIYKQLSAKSWEGDSYLLSVRGRRFQSEGTELQKTLKPSCFLVSLKKNFTGRGNLAEKTTETSERDPRLYYHAGKTRTIAVRAAMMVSTLSHKDDRVNSLVASGDMLLTFWAPSRSRASSSR